MSAIDFAQVSVTVTATDRTSGRTEQTRAFPAGATEGGVGRSYSAALSLKELAGASDMHWVHLSVSEAGKVRLVSGARAPGKKFALHPCHEAWGSLDGGRARFEYEIDDRFQIEVEIGPRRSARPADSRESARRSGAMSANDLMRMLESAERVNRPAREAAPKERASNQGKDVVQSFLSKIGIGRRPKAERPAMRAPMPRAHSST